MLLDMTNHAYAILTILMYRFINRRIEQMEYAILSSLWHSMYIIVILVGVVYKTYLEKGTGLSRFVSLGNHASGCKPRRRQDMVYTKT